MDSFEQTMVAIILVQFIGWGLIYLWTKTNK
jgi:hypothetical protein